MPDVAIPWYHPHHCIALLEIAPGDSHGPDGPRNDSLYFNNVADEGPLGDGVHYFLESGRSSSAITCTSLSNSSCVVSLHREMRKELSITSGERRIASSVWLR